MKPITLRIYVAEDAPALKPAGDHLTAEDVARYLEARSSEPYGASVNELSDREIGNIATGIAEREYRDTVTGIVEDLKRAIADGEIADRDAADEWLSETIDGHHDVIYTYYAQQVVRHSKNDGAYFDEFGTDGAVTDGGIEWSKLAYMALLADVREEIGDLEEWFRCSECGCAVEEMDLKLAGTENLPTCADCRAGEDEDKDSDNESDEA